MSYLVTFGAFLSAMLAAYGLGRWWTGLARAASLRWGVLSPVTDRSSHSSPTPRLGGLGLALAFGFSAALFLGVVWAVPWIVAVAGRDGGAGWDANDLLLILGFDPALVGWVALGWVGMLAVGLADDRFDLAPLLKLAAMTLAALAPILGAGVRLEPVHWAWLSTGGHACLSALLTLGWVLFFVNAYNFMDGMDGFAAHFARVSAVAMFIVVMMPGFIFGTLALIRAEAYLLPILAMVCWGFLHWNRPPARVFMGDGGSLSVGYLLAVFPLLGQGGYLGLPLPWVTSLTILLPFIFDVVLTLVRRLERGENLLRAHREHLYQRLMKQGLSHAEVLRLNHWRFVGCAGLALAGSWWGGWWGPWLALAAAMGLMLEYWWSVQRREQAEPAS